MINVHCVYVSAGLWALPLRGGAYWEHLGQGLKFRYKIGRLFSSRMRKIPTPEVKINAPIPVPPPCPSLLFVCMPNSEAAVRVASEFRDAGSHVIVDYVGDVLGVTAPDDYSPAAWVAGKATAESSRDYWSQPEVHEVLRNCLSLATAITTPFPEFIPGLAHLTGGRVPAFHLPDLPSSKAKDIFQFNRNLSEIMHKLS